MTGIGLCQGEAVKKIDLEELDPACDPTGEIAHRVARIALGAIPSVGGTMVEIFNSMFEAPLSKRRNEAIIQIAGVVNQLIEERVVTEEGLQSNDAFISTVAEVCSISLRNHQSEKLEALRNAVRNSALPSCPADDYRQIFLSFVDQCTVTHIKLLRFADDPAGWFKLTGHQFPGYVSGDITGVLEAAIPELKGHAALRNAIWNDLESRGLISAHLTMESKGPDESFDRTTTELGAELVRFIDQTD
jgi:hypothetical protein